MDDRAPSQTNMQPAVLVIFGITGDLANRKVLPALYNLFKNNLVHDQTFIVGTSRRLVEPSAVIDALRSSLQSNDLPVDNDVLERLQAHLSMQQVDPDSEGDYAKLGQHLQGIEDSLQTCLTRLFYLSVPPQAYGTIIENLGRNNLQNGCVHGKAASRLLVEKPFGYDLQSAEQLIAKTAEHFNEEQIFRIDHYLAKETAQNILTFRTANPLFSEIWNRHHVTMISITTAESIGIEGRADFYNRVGALRDQVQSHLMQLLALTLMEVPATLSARTVHAAKLAVLNNILPIDSTDVANQAVRGQYQGYEEEIGKQSNTETFASIVLYSQDPAWQGVPLRLTTGKGLKLKRSSITITFGRDQVNRLQFQLQPDEGIRLSFHVKQPGLDEAVTPKALNFSYQDSFQTDSPPDAYERVLIEALEGDQTLFATDAEVLASWRILQPIMNAWGQDMDGLERYEFGSDGPDNSRLIQNGAA